MWKEVMRLDYDPSVYIKKVQPKRGRSSSSDDVIGLKDAVAELTKYATKPMKRKDMDEEWLRIVADQIVQLRFIDSGGVLRGILADNYGDGEGESEGAAEEDDERLFFRWWQDEKHYRQQR